MTKLTAIIMAGGKGSRIGGELGEKPLVKIGGTEMLRRVHRALKRSRYVGHVFVACSPNTPLTLREAKRWGMRVIKTPGHGYVEDMRYAVRRLRLQDAVLVVNSDLPFLTPDLIDSAVERFLRDKKPALEVVVLSLKVRKLGFEPAYPSGSGLSPAGLNVLDARAIDDSGDMLEHDTLVVRKASELVNVNTPEEAQRAEQLLLTKRFAGGKGGDAR